MDILFDPFAPIEDRLEDSVRKGYISAKNADLLARTYEWVEDNASRILEKFPGQAVCVTSDSTLESGFATYVGDTGYAAEAKARQFSPDVPFVTFNSHAQVASDRSQRLAAMMSMLLLLDDDKPNGKPKAKQGDEKKDDNDKADPLPKLDKFVSENSDEEIAKRLKITCGTNLVAYAQGFIQIAKGNCVFKVFGVDSQATNSSISSDNFKRLEKKGAKLEKKGTITVVTPAGDASFDKYTGVTMKFPRDDGMGKTEIVSCTEPFIVTNADVLGADQLKATGTRLIWDPAAGTAELQKSPPKK